MGVPLGFSQGRWKEEGGRSGPGDAWPSGGPGRWEEVVVLASTGVLAVGLEPPPPLGQRHVAEADSAGCKTVMKSWCNGGLVTVEGGA